MRDKGALLIEEFGRVHAMKCETRISVMAPDWDAVLLVLYPEKATWLPSVGSTATRTQDLIDKRATLQNWDGIHKGHQVGS